MLYYKVKKEGDQKEYGKKGWFLVATTFNRPQSNGPIIG